MPASPCPPADESIDETLFVDRRSPFRKDSFAEPARRCVYGSERFDPPQPRSSLIRTPSPSP